MVLSLSWKASKECSLSLQSTVTWLDALRIDLVRDIDIDSAWLCLRIPYRSNRAHSLLWTVSMTRWRLYGHDEGEVFCGDQCDQQRLYRKIPLAVGLDQFTDWIIFPKGFCMACAVEFAECWHLCLQFCPNFQVQRRTVGRTPSLSISWGLLNFVLQGPFS